jgi:hypothetical protein
MDRWLPKIEALDMIKVEGKIYIRKTPYMCFNREKTDGMKLDKIINSLMEKDPYKRLTIKECLDKHF